MEEKEGIPLKLLCMACLCVGRTLRNISDEKMKQFYINTFNEIPLCNTSLVNIHVCWECEALTKKVITFREQVQDSYRILQTYPTENLQECLFSDIVRSPHLSQGKVSTLSISPTQDTNKQSTNEDLKDELKVDWDKNATSLYITQNFDDDCSANETADTLDVEIETLIDKAKSISKSKDRKKRTKKSSKPKRTRGMENHDLCPLENTLIDHRGKSPIAINNIEENDKLQVEHTDIHENNDLDAINVDPFNIEIESLVSKVKEKNKDKISSKLRKAQKHIKRLQKGLKSTKRRKMDDQRIIVIDLSYEEMLLERDKEATRDSYINAAYKCNTCLIGFNYKNSYKAHLTAKHSPDRGDYICPICSTIINSLESFTAHYKRHLRRYECSICQKRTADMKVMQKHYYTTHEVSLKEYKCDICGKISNSMDTHRYHKDSHKARVQCKECDKTFTHRAGLLNHRLSVHELNNAFPCTVCEKVFRWKTSLKRHLEKHDLKDKSPTAAYCSTCGVTFASVCSYQRHMRNSLRHVTQEQLRYVCDHCKRRFADKTKLRDHIEEKHLHKTYQCHICLKPSKNRVGLDQHIRNVHKGRPNNKMCHHCGKGFPTKLQLESHIRTHTGERPFICEFCPTTFSQQSNLYKHNRQVHSNIKTKRYSSTKKRREGKTIDISAEGAMDPYRPVAVLQYSPDRGFVM